MAGGLVHDLHGLITGLWLHSKNKRPLNTFKENFRIKSAHFVSASTCHTKETPFYCRKPKPKSLAIRKNVLHKNNMTE